MKSILAVLVFLVSVPTVRAQYGVNWPTQPATPLAKDVLAGPQKLKISGVNDFLYSYDVNIVEITTPVPINLPGGAAQGGCTAVPADLGTLVTDTQAAHSSYLALFPAPGSSSKSLVATQTEWTTKVKPAYDKLESDAAAAQKAVDQLADPPQRFCQALLNTQKDTYTKILQPADAKLNKGPHVVEASFVVKNCKSEILTIIEKYQGAPTGQSITVQLDAECDEVTVSGGVLLSEIQNRTYTATSLPTQTGQFLSVGDTGKFRPTLTVLTSFNFPFRPLGQTVSKALGDWRLGISVGPIVQNSKSDVSSFGWFVGGTVSFLKRLYLSPGIHVGEFADFPPGFVANQQIPANFGTLNPVKRWTARFGIAITIKGWDASKTFKGGQDQPTPAPTKP